ncbi:MAG: hypothetical protein KC431_25425 [Myxococcales bacterium]|nr:hypothetical protein [Myxococcales bacterium]
MTRYPALSRRGALRVGLGAFGGLLCGCRTPALGRADLESEPPPPGLSPALYESLRLASLAPSGHNAQPWYVRVKGDRLTISKDAACELPAVDPDNRELAISIGAFVETFVLAAGAQGLAAEVKVVGADTQADEYVRIALSPATVSGYQTARIEQRRTLRKGHNDRSLDPAMVTVATGPLESFSVIPAASPRGRRLREITYEANRQQIQRDDAQRELAAWMRFDDESIRRLRDGLTPASMELSKTASRVVGRYDQDEVMSPRFRKRSLAVVEEQLASFGAWLVVTGADDLAGLIETGRQWQRSALLMREFGLALHPMSQALEELPWRDELASELGLAVAPQMLARLSAVDDYAAPVSPRRPVSWFVDIES